MMEIWKDTSHKGYQVSNLGNVRSLDREVVNSLGRKYYFKGQIIKGDVNSAGYRRVVLKQPEERCFVHRLVAELFIPNPLNLPIVNHKDGNKLNCAASNLQWSDYPSNAKHAYDTGLTIHPVGEAWHNSKLTEQNVKEARKDYATGKYTYQFLADRYGVSRRALSKAVTGKNWNHVKN